MYKVSINWPNICLFGGFLVCSLCHLSFCKYYLSSCFQFIWAYIITRSGIAGSCGNSVYIFEGPSKCFPQQLHHFTFPSATHRVPNSPHTHQHLISFFLILFCLGIMIILTGTKWCLIVLLDCVALIYDVEHLVKCSLFLCISSLRNVYLSFTHFLIEL